MLKKISLSVLAEVDYFSLESAKLSNGKRSLQARRDFNIHFSGEEWRSTFLAIARAQNPKFSCAKPQAFLPRMSMTNFDKCADATSMRKLQTQVQET